MDLQSGTILALGLPWDAEEGGSAKWWIGKECQHLGISQLLEHFVWELGTKSKGLISTLSLSGLCSQVMKPIANPFEPSLSHDTWSVLLLWCMQFGVLISSSSSPFPLCPSSTKSCLADLRGMLNFWAVIYHWLTDFLGGEFLVEILLLFLLVP